MLPQRPGDDPRRYGNPSISSASNRLPPFGTGSENSPRPYLPPSPGHMTASYHQDVNYWDRERPPTSSSTGGGGGGGGSGGAGPGPMPPKWSPSLMSSFSQSRSSRFPPGPWDHPSYPPGAASGSGGGSGGAGGNGAFRHPSSPHIHMPTPMSALHALSTDVSPYRQHSPTSPGGSSISMSSPPMGSRHSQGPEGGGPRRKKKRRVALSCAECAKRKQKCNRETPCQHCVSRRVPELCVPYTREGSPPVKRRASIKTERSDKAEPASAVAVASATAPKPPNQLPTLTVRVSRIEALLNAMVNRVDGVEGKALDDWRINHAPASSPPPVGASRRRSRADSTISSARRLSEHEDSARAEEVYKIDRESSIRNPLPQVMMSSSQPVHRALDFHGTPAEEFERLMRGNGIKISVVQDLLADLPNRAHADILVDRFFKVFNFVRYPIDETAFRTGFEYLYSNVDRLNPKGLLLLPLVMIIFSIGVRLSPEGIEGDEEARKRESMKWYRNTRIAISVARTITAETIQLVETRILLGLYLILMNERRLSEGWAELRNAITSAQIIGLHRDGTIQGCDAYSTEYRRRLWSYLIHADSTYSCLLGRPTCIEAESSDAQFPSNVDLEALPGRKPSETEPKPLSETTFATYLILRRHLGEIVAQTCRLFSRVSKPIQYEEIKEIESLFRKFIANLPPDFQMIEPDKSHDKDLWYLPIHRYYIQTEILHFRIILHRPYLLRKLRSSRYAPSRTASFDSAVLDFKIRMAFKKDVPDFFETLLGGSFREFNVAMIAGISEIIDPRSSRAADMRAITQSFLDNWPYDESTDQFSKKEAGIIYTLHRRAKEAEERRATRPRTDESRLHAHKTSAERDEPRRIDGISPRSGSTANGTGRGSDASSHGMFMMGSTAQIPWQNGDGLGMDSGMPRMVEDEQIDQPQQLLNHWLFHNQMVNPPISFVTNGANPPMYDPSVVPLSASGMPMQMGIPTDGGITGWMNPAGASEPGMMPGQPVDMGMGHSVPQIGLGMNMPGHEGDGSMNISWDDGNNVQFWNKMIDGIQTAQGGPYQMMSNA